MACNPNNPAIGGSVCYGKPSGASGFTVVIGTVLAVYAGTNPLEIKLSHSGGQVADHVKHSPCAARNRWGCEGEFCDPQSGQAYWTFGSDERMKVPA